MALYMVSSLVVPSLHLAFAHHRHTFDFETGQFLDVLVAGENQEVFSQILDSSSENTILFPKIERSFIYKYCAIASGLRLTYIPATGITGCVRASEIKNLRPLIEAACQPQSLILAIAPKRSPPRTTA